MPDFIKRSIELDPWLRAQGITVEVDEFAPAIYRTTDPQYDDCGELFVSMQNHVATSEFVAPFFAPGGEGNSIKALEEYAAENDCVLQRLNYNFRTRVCWRMRRKSDDTVLFDGDGKTDGEALADLLWKIKEASE